VVQNGPGYEINGNYGGPGWDVFTVEQQAGVMEDNAENNKQATTYALKTANGRYITAQPDGELKGEYTSAGTWEGFTSECISGIWIFHEN
jgi:hypothetical protein